METELVHCKSPHDVYIGRPSKYGNPFVRGVDGNRTECIEKFRRYFYANEQLQRDAEFLRGKKIACWCSPKTCHGDVYVEFLQQTQLDL